MQEYSDAYCFILIQCTTLIFGNEGVCPPFVNYFVEKLLQRGRNSVVCNSNCHYSENTNLNRNVASSLCISIKGKHLFLVLDVHVCDPLCLRYMHLRVWFPALCNLVYKYWIAVICESLAKRIISQHQFNVIEQLSCMELHYVFVK